MDGNEGNAAQLAATQEGEIIEALRKEVEQLRGKNTNLQNQLDNALSEVTVAECIKEDLIELERQRSSLEDEKKTLESLLNETRDEVTSTRTHYEHECARLRAVNEQLELENKEAKIHHKSLVADFSEVGGGSGNLVDKEALSVFTDATKSLARRVKSNLMPGGAGGNSTVSFSRLHHHDKSDDSSDTSPVNHDPTGMQRAFEDTEALKSIIVPLEEQITALKDKLRQTDTLLREFEKHQAHLLFSAEILGRWLTGKKSFSDAMDELASHSDTMPSEDDSNGSVLKTLLIMRLSLVVKELSDLRSQNDRCVNELERSVKKYADLRSQTAEANGRLLQCQKKHHSELVRLCSVLTEEQKLALSTDHQAVNDEQTPTSMTSDEIVINRAEWDALHAQLDKLRAVMGLGLDVDVVGSDQFKQLQSQLHELRGKLEKQSQREEKLKSEMQVMEQQWNQRAEEHQKQTTDLTDQVNQSRDLLSQLLTSHRHLEEDSKKKLHSLSSDRERIVNEIKRLQDDNDNLVGKRNAKARELQNEVINLPEKTEDMHHLLLTYQQQLIDAKTAAEFHEDKRRQNEAELKAKVNDLTEQLLLMESCKSELEAVQKRSLEIEMMAKNLQNDKTRLEKEAENGAMHRSRFESQNAELKARISNLQQELDNSVAVQTDFVRLSQSLQMELEKIRQSEKEVSELICKNFEDSLFHDSKMF